MIEKRLRNRNTIEFLGIWEHLNNPDFKPVEFDGIRKKAGLNSFILTAKRWILKSPTTRVYREYKNLSDLAVGDGLKF